MHVEWEGLWYRVLTATYGEEGGRICEGRRGASTWWENILRLRDEIGMGIGSLFDDNMRRLVGDGASSFFWTNKWVEDEPFCVRFRRLFETRVLKVAEMCLLRWGGG